MFSKSLQSYLFSHPFPHEYKINPNQYAAQQQASKFCTTSVQHFIHIHFHENSQFPELFFCVHPHISKSIVNEAIEKFVVEHICCI